MNSKPNDLGLTAKAPNAPVVQSLGPVGVTGHPGVAGVSGLVADGLDGPPAAAAAPTAEPKVKAFIILIRHVTKGTLHVVSRANGPIVEFEDMEHAINTASTLPACQQNPHFIQSIFE